MKIASITQTKNQLSALLDEVRRGESILILDRKRPIARIEPVTGSTRTEEEGQLAKLERQGLLRRAQSPLQESFFQSKPPGSSGEPSLLEALLRERDENR
ncbi:MAG: type II toxin-antitoxin system Phd/YefM family antitoxin [Acidobacteriota bacterium]